MTATTSQIAMIHTLKSRAGMDDDAYRGFLQANFRVVSSKQLSLDDAKRAIDRLKVMAGQATPAANGAVAGLDTPIGGKLRALWIAGYDLGLVRDRTDRALLAFLQRQTGVSHTRFLRHPGDATAAIEALKRWLDRDGGVIWPASNDAQDQKRAVCEAIWARLVARGKVTGEFGELHSKNLDLVQNYLGRLLRMVLAHEKGAAS